MESMLQNLQEIVVRHHLASRRFLRPRARQLCRYRPLPEGPRLHDYAALVPTLDLPAERIDGIGLAGPGRWVRSLTGALKLFR
jgi:hypothetical protein